MAEKVEKERLDVLLVQRGLAPGRDQAKAYIMAGNVYVDGMKEDKAGTKIPVTAEIEVRDAAMKYVSRGGYKLEKAMEVFPITLTDKICLDSQTVCCKTAPQRYIPSTLDMVSLHGNCATTPESFVWKKPMCAM